MADYIDARGKRELEYLDQCATCKEEYAVRLHLRHQCGDCNRKWLHETFDRPFIDFDRLWKSFDQMFDRFEKVFDAWRH